MKEFKFECPSCGQRLQCNDSDAGRPLQCPGCDSRIEIPHPKHQHGSHGSLPKATLLGPKKSSGSTQALKSGKSEVSATEKKRATGRLALAKHAKPEAKEAEPAARADDHSAPASKKGAPERFPHLSASEPKPKPASAPAEKKPALEGPGEGKAPGHSRPPREAAPARAKDPHVLCPVCDSELSVPLSKLEGSSGKPVEATLVSKGAKAAEPSASSAAAESTKTDERSSSKVAPSSGRPGGGMKPRLSYILTGKPPEPKTSDE